MLRYRGGSGKWTSSLSQSGITLALTLIQWVGIKNDRDIEFCNKSKKRVTNIDRLPEIRSIDDGGIPEVLYFQVFDQDWLKGCNKMQTITLEIIEMAVISANGDALQ
ncbi:hypothetical protein O181_066324 [Austropuccinia psidii MF-1]|uniref:Uncharacterized protein n=1 Tax=Austropuccinia psidii MF-1 TaxID=1389203 RepID=A0A9Q3ETA0_9BASI|nr:hypothetical protein [Austropuccinia psidii MF-1]